ncbi:MAG: GNAT family N-acetyltransferase [Nanoarchaeota archaeon]
MKIVKATIKDAKAISELMLSDLQNPPKEFPEEMVDKFREHAREENIKKEFQNPELILFIAENEKNIVGFIVGYKEVLKNNAMIHYVTANKIEIKKKLLERVIQECRLKKIKKVITDGFEFMENDKFFKSQGFIFTKKEKIAPNLEMLWYELNLN